MKLLASILVASAFGQDGRRRGNKGASAESEVSTGGFGDSYGSYGDYGSNYGFGDEYAAGAFGSYDSYDGGAFGNYDSYGFDTGFDATTVAPVESVVEATAAPATAAAAPAAPAVGKEFQADDATAPGGGNAPNDDRAGHCLVGHLTANNLGQFNAVEVGNLATEPCFGADPEATEDSRDYCLVEVRSENGVYTKWTGRCVTLDDCESALANNFQHPNGVPSLHDQCRPTKVGAVGVPLQSGRWKNFESVCRTCSHMNNNADSTFNVQITGGASTSIKILNHGSAALQDSNSAQDIKDWNRAAWLQVNGGGDNTFENNVHFVLQEA